MISPNATYRLPNISANNYLECHQMCKDYNRFPYQACNVWTFCAQNTSAGCVDGNGEKVGFGSCSLGFQGNLTSSDQQPLSFRNKTQEAPQCLRQIAMNPGLYPSVGAGVSINATEVELYQEAGLFNVTTNYVGETVKHANATSPLDCYSRCKAFNDVPGKYCNVFVFCGRPGGCNGGFSNNSSEYPFGLCDLKTQAGLSSTAVWPAAYGRSPWNNVTTLGSGACKPNSWQSRLHRLNL